jgi:radical SAM superfamily enzyme YgiQ (UPF0313 family)
MRTDYDPNAAPHVLLVNPWIHDFAAYDVWAKPYGLLSLAAVLRSQGVKVSYIDCLDRFHPRMAPVDPSARHGRGPYLKTPLSKPKGLEKIARTYSRYGIRPEWLEADLAALVPPPDLILVTSLMTYWYPGVFEAIGVLKARFPKTPLVLGGIYARLCSEHARAHSGADQVVTDRGESLWEVVKAHTGWDAAPVPDPGDLEGWPYPALDLQRRIPYVPLLTARGCPFDCAYCATHFLEPARRRRSPDHVLAEILFWHDRYGVREFAFYDDAFLVDAQRHALPLLESIIRSRRPLFFHTPNALHIREITTESATLMFRAGFHTVRLGLETTAFEERGRLDRKVNEEEFMQAVGCLRAAGFRADQVGAYLLVGLPGQAVAAVEQSIRVVQRAGITPILAHYSPIPHTRLWEAAVAASRYDLNADPIFSNNAIFPCSRDDFSWPALSRLKTLAQTPPIDSI